MTGHHDLYGLPLEQFVAARKSLAQTLREGGHREQAAEIMALRKPSLAVRAVNQLIRAQGREITALFEAGDALQRAQSELLAGRGDGQALRAAVARERDAVGELADLARGLLSSDGHELTESMLDRVTGTLHAAALDKESRVQLEDGRLVRELEHIGLGQLGVIVPAGSPTPTRSRERTRLPAPS